MTGARYRDALANREIRGIVTALTLSLWGDQLARLAVGVLVLSRTGSAFLAALAFAVSYLPDVVGGPLLGPWSDRLPRRRVMLFCDAVRAVLVALLALPGLPVGLALLDICAVTLFTSPFGAAQRALVTDILPPPLVAAGIAVSALSHQVNQALGLLLGGAVLALLSPRGALLADAASFVASLALIAATVRPRPPADLEPSPGLRGYLRDAAEGFVHVRTNRAARALMLYAWAIGLCGVAAEGIGVPYAVAEHHAAATGGLLVAALSAGFTAGVLVMPRLLDTERQLQRMLLLAALSMVPLGLTAARPPIAATFVLWALSAALQAAMVPAMGGFSLALPSRVRGRGTSLAAGGLGLAQVVAIAGGGLLAQEIGPALAVASAAVLGLALIGLLWVWWPASEVEAVAATLRPPAASPSAVTPGPAAPSSSTAAVRLPGD